jgi:hypothetical protein
MDIYRYINVRILRKDNTAALESICSAIWDDAM